MTAFVDFLRRFVDVSRSRHHLNRRRRLVAALLAGAGGFLLITALRSPAPVLRDDPATRHKASVGSMLVGWREGDDAADGVGRSLDLHAGCDR